MSVLDEIYTCTLRQAKDFIFDCVMAGVVPFIRSSPGMGKSSMVGSVANDAFLWMIDHRLSTSNPVDMTGLPGFKDGVANFMPFEDVFPIASTPIPGDRDGFLLFLDEANSAPKSVQAAAYKLILDRAVGQHKLHPNTAIVLAGNHDTDGAITTRLSTAMQSRLVHLNIRFDFKEFVEDVMIPQAWDPRILAYLNWKPDHALDFKPDHSNDTFCCPRTWEFMHKLIKGKPLEDRKLPLYAGVMTSGVAVDFVQFTKVYDSLPRIEQILADPSGMPVPHDSATKWATIGYLVEKADKKNFDQICIYVERFTIEFKILFFRGVIAAKPQLRDCPGFKQNMGKISRYLHAPIGQTYEPLAA